MTIPSIKLTLITLMTAALAKPQSQFDVVSIKLAPPGARNSGYRRSPAGVLNATNVTLKMLVAYAYDVREYQISGGPGWFETERYEILAKGDPAAPEPSSTSERTALMRTRVQAMLTDRFHLTLHRTAKELPIFHLVIGKNGPKGLRESTASQSDLVDNGHHLTCHKTSLDSFARIFLQGELRRPVLNQTNLPGEFDFTMDWTPDEGRDQPATGDSPSFFTALQEQLGLKLVPAKGPVEILLIDHADHPSEN